MMRVRMVTTGAGPDGVMPSGAVLLVADALAQRLAEGGFAVILGPEIETAIVQPAVEQAVAPAQVKPKRRTRKKT